MLDLASVLSAANGILEALRAILGKANDMRDLKKSIQEAEAEMKHIRSLVSSFDVHRLNHLT
eukprot:IDg11818t1